jgi:hypothetical protein
VQSDTIELLKAHVQVFRKTSPWRAFHTRGYAHISRAFSYGNLSPWLQAVVVFLLPGVDHNLSSLIKSYLPMTMLITHS